MSLKQYYGKHVQIIDHSGRRFSGRVSDYIYPEDNENEKESIIIDTPEGIPTEFYSEDIQEICLI